MLYIYYIYILYIHTYEQARNQCVYVLHNNNYLSGLVDLIKKQQPCKAILFKET